MPKYAFLETPLLCPQCKTHITDLLWFQWGYCPSSDPQSANMYHIGDRIRWRVCADGTVPAWTIFLDEPRQPANIGTHTVRHILVQEVMHFFWEPGIEAVHYDPQYPTVPLDPQKAYYGGDHPLNQPRLCPTCQARLAGAFIEIRDNIITKAWIYALGAFDHRVDYHIITADGTIVPMSEWNNHPMLRKATC